MGSLRVRYERGPKFLGEDDHPFGIRVFNGPPPWRRFLTGIRVLTGRQTKILRGLFPTPIEASVRWLRGVCSVGIGALVAPCEPLLASILKSFTSSLAKISYTLDVMGFHQLS